MIEPGIQRRVEEALSSVQDYFLRTQDAHGYWWGELESNPTMEAEHLLLVSFLGTDEGERIALVANDIRRRQREDGSWGMYYGAPGDLSTSVECYFALKLAGDRPEEPHMEQAREFILSKGGVPEARIFTKIWLALFGQWPWEGTPVMPPEMILIPSWAPFNIYRWSSWARATVVPLTVVPRRKNVSAVRSAWLASMCVKAPARTGVIPSIPSSMSCALCRISHGAFRFLRSLSSS